MKATKFLACIALCGSSLLSLAETAQAAPGVVIDKSLLAAAERQSLEREVSKAKGKNPKVFEQVAKSPDLAAEADENKRGSYASITRPLQALGPEAVIPMLEMLAVDGPPRGKMSDGAWLTLRVSLLEAVGRLRDARSRPVLMAIIKNTSEFEIVRAAAEALGRLGDDKSAKHLATAVKRGGNKQLAILGGIGECRRAGCRTRDELDPGARRDRQLLGMADAGREKVRRRRESALDGRQGAAQALHRVRRRSARKGRQSHPRGR
jgi:HEAT repeat protein